MGGVITTAGYHSNGGSGNKDNIKGNSGKNGERGGNNRGSASHLCLIFGILHNPKTQEKMIIHTYININDEDGRYIYIYEIGNRKILVNS